MKNFRVLHRDAHSRARAGELTTSHGTVQTPVFLPVGTQGTVKAMTPADLLDLDARIILGNTYHLMLRPGHQVVQEMGGLHRFTAWPRALLTDTVSVGSNSFATGTLDISASPASAVFNVSDMAPGDSAVDDILLTNGGSLALRYAVTSTTTENTLAAQLDLTIWDEVEESVVDGTCDTTAPATKLYTAADLGSTSGVDVVGDPTSGADSGDQAMAASATQRLCFLIELPLATGDSFQGLSSTATFAFAAEQTANN